jgi:hypothetical protein
VGERKKVKRGCEEKDHWKQQYQGGVLEVEDLKRGYKVIPLTGRTVGADLT